MKYLLIIIFITSCNPVNKVLNDPKKLEKVKHHLIESGMCINDTITVETYVRGEDSIIKVPCADFDTTKDSIRIYVKDSILKYIKINKVITKIVRDTKYEDQLKNDLKIKESEILKLKSKVVDLSEEVRDLKRKTLKLRIAFSIVVFLSTLIILRKPIARAIVKI